ncbi:MAG: PKD domain protein [Bacteroidetes bacterium ADurb.Bin408]|nr:MAG: PKD domain protein [Bacteroidetes bacterium ADurb.Bin408]
MAKTLFHKIIISRYWICLIVLMGNICLSGYAQSFEPQGYLDYVDMNGGNGWAYDEDAGMQPIEVHIYIDNRLYAILLADESRPDLVSNGFTPNPEHGFSFFITGFDTTRAHEIAVYAIDYGGTSSTLLGNCPSRVRNIPAGDAVISHPAGPSDIVITTSQRLAVAIGSLIWDGKEFIDSYDHGRELQSALSFNHWGECYNPTEAGCALDDTGSTSTSFLQYLSTSGNMLETQTLPAFWTQPGDTAPVCGYALNTTERAPYYFHKKVQIGMPGMPHVIQYNTSFDMPVNTSYNIGAFEVTTAYMPIDFSVFWTYNPASQILTPLTDGPGEQGLPVIIATANSNYALGIYSPDLPDTMYPDKGYGRFRYDDCTKWNCVFKKTPVTEGTYNFRSYVIAGSLNNVTVSMTQLYNYFIVSADFTADTTCAGMPVVLTDQSIGVNAETLYYWDIYDDGVIDDSTQGNISYTFNTAGIYPVRLTVINGIDSAHRSTIVKNVIVIDKPDAGLISGHLSVCEGSEQVYYVTTEPGALYYSWTLPLRWTGLSDVDSITATASIMGGVVAVSVTNQCGTGQPAYLNVNVNAPPHTPVITYILIILSSNAQSGNQWYNENGPIQGATGAIFKPLSQGCYYVMVTDANGCVSEPSNIICNGITNTPFEINTGEALNLWYNSLSHKLNIISKDLSFSAKGRLTVYTTASKMVKKKVLEDQYTVIDLNDLHDGFI